MDHGSVYKKRYDIMSYRFFTGTSTTYNTMQYDLKRKSNFCDTAGRISYSQKDKILPQFFYSGFVVCGFSGQGIVCYNI